MRQIMLESVGYTKDEVDILVDLIKKLDIGILSQREYMLEVDKLYKQVQEDKK
jgi:hypothetical protein